MRRLTFFISLLMALEFIGQGVSLTRDVEATDDGIIVTDHFNGGFHPIRTNHSFWSEVLEILGFYGDEEIFVRELQYKISQ
jgi:hypothetical protein